MGGQRAGLAVVPGLSVVSRSAAPRWSAVPQLHESSLGPVCGRRQSIVVRPGGVVLEDGRVVELGQAGRWRRLWAVESTSLTVRGVARTERLCLPGARAVRSWWHCAIIAQDVV